MCLIDFETQLTAFLHTRPLVREGAIK
jgi:hypothetical protein